MKIPTQQLPAKADGSTIGSNILNTLAPIVLFVYNRPEHTRQTIQALQANQLASDSELFIYSDAPKNVSTERKVKEVREYIRSVAGFKNVTLIERDKNWGLADSIIDGVTSIVNQYGKIIVLEDDLVTSFCFLRFMNDALEIYKDQSKVMHISGWNYPIEVDGLGETFFFRGASCWGWATWDVAWRLFEKDVNKLCETFTKEDRYKLDYEGMTGMWSQVEDNKNKKLNTWAIFWYATVFKQNGLCLHPTQSMVNNIGHDGSGVHCDESILYNTDLADYQITNFEQDISESVLATDRIKRFFRKKKKNILLRIINKIKQLLFV